jgi:hypothetical protein
MLEMIPENLLSCVKKNGTGFINNDLRLTTSCHHSDHCFPEQIRQ